MVPRFFRLHIAKREQRKSVSKLQHDLRGPKENINMRISHPGSRAHNKGNTKNNMVGRILMFLWSLGTLDLTFPVIFP